VKAASCLHRTVRRRQQHQRHRAIRNRRAGVEPEQFLQPDRDGRALLGLPAPENPLRAFESDDTLSGHTLPSAPNLTNRRFRAIAQAPPSSICLQALAFKHLPSSTCLQALAFKHLPSSICLQALAFKHSKPAQPSSRGRGHITGSPEGVRKQL
jgi:hypothetical protein